MDFIKPSSVATTSQASRPARGFRGLRVLALLCASCLVQACSTSVPSLSFPGVYRIAIPQGNIITQDMVDQLRPGLSKRQVNYIMGTPLVRDTFNQDRWDYLYSIQPGGGERMQEQITLYFEDGELVRFEGDFEQSENNRQFAQPDGLDEPDEEAAGEQSEEQSLAAQ